MNNEPENDKSLNDKSTAEGNIRPGFLKHSDSEEKRGQAAKDLQSSEQAAAGQGSGQLAGRDSAKNKGGLESAKNAESDMGGGFYSGGGKNKQKARGKFFGKKFGPVGVIMLILLGGGGLLFSSQAMEPFALVNNLIENFDSGSYSTAMRFKKILKGAADDKRFKKTDQLEDALKQVGIEIEADDDGKITKYSYETTEVDENGKTHTKKVEADNIGSLIENDSVAMSKISKAAEILENKSFYNNKVKKFAMERIKWVRNRFVDMDTREYSQDMVTEFKETAGVAVDVDVGTQTDKKYKIKIEKQDGSTETVEAYKATDGDRTYYISVESGKEVSGEIVEKIPQSDSNLNLGSKDEAAANVENIAKKQDNGDTKISLEVSDVVSNGVSGFSTASCVFSAVTTAVSAMVIAEQVSDMMNFASGYMEAIQKVQSGDGTGASLHAYNNETNKTNSDGEGFWTAISIVSLFGGDTKSSSAGIANLENVFTDEEVLNAGASLENWQACTYSKVISGVTNLALSFAGVAGAGAKKLLSAVSTTIISGALAVAMEEAIKKVTEVAAKAIAVDVIEDMSSPEAGDYVVGGTNLYFGKMAQAIGLSAGTEEKRTEFAYASQGIIAERAQYDRDNLSPLDITSKNTFLGSIVYSLTQLAVLNGGKLTSSISSALTVLSSSITKLMPTSSAMTYLDFATEPGDCPLLESVGATGTANLCINYTISDMDTMDISYEDAIAYLEDEGELKEDSDGNITIVDDGELARYLQYWTVRDTHLGLADSAAVSTVGSTGNDTVDAVVSSLPIVGDVQDILDGTIDASKEGYILGSKYVAGGDEWEEMQQYIQTFLEMDSLYSDLGFIEDSSVVAYLTDYYEENPIDNSYEGMLARYSGLSKETVAALLDYMEYREYVASYNPSERYVFAEPEITVDAGMNFGSEDVMSGEVILISRATYADVRNRNFVA